VLTEASDARTAEAAANIMLKVVCKIRGRMAQDAP
jgi:hypothetical protein